MTAYLAPRPEDVYDAETVAGFRAAGYWRDETLSASVDRLAGQDRVVLTDGYGALTGTELREQAYRLAAALRRLGVGASRHRPTRRTASSTLRAPNRGRRAACTP